MDFDPRWAHGHDLPRLASLTATAARPAVWSRLAALAWTGPDGVAALIEAIYDDLERELPDADLAGLGLDLIAPGRAEADRMMGCIWLTLYPSVESASAMAAIVGDATASLDLRDQAAWTLGFRQVQQRAPTLRWPAEAVAIADAALADAFFADPAGELTQLVEACQHVAAPALHDRLAAALLAGAVPLDRAAAAVDAFASPALAAALLDRIAALRADHAAAVIPLIAHTLGEAAAPALLAFAHDAPIAPRCEALWGALAFAPAAAAAPVAALIAASPMMPQLAARAAWHRDHPGRVPLTAALQIARTTALLPATARAAAGHRACVDLATLARLEAPMPGDAFGLWRHVAYLAGGADAIDCVALDRQAIDRAPFLLPPLLDALARAGRFVELTRTAAAHGETARATWLLARGGRPYLALRMRRLARGDDLLALAGQALALFAAGRPDLAVLTLRLPPRTIDDAEVGRAWSAAEPLSALVGLAVPAPAGADPDVLDQAALASLDRALRADLGGAAVHLAGRFPDPGAVRAAIEGRGGLVVSGPFGKVDYVLVGDDVDPGELARLTSLGATPISATHLEATPPMPERT